VAAAPESQLIAAYRGLQRRIEEMLASAQAGGRSTVFLEGQARAAAAALRDVQAAETGFVSSAIPDQYKLSAQAAQLTIAEAGLATLQGSFTGFDRAAVRFLQERVSSRLTNVRQALTDGLGLGDPKTAAKFIEAALGADGKLVRTVAGELKVLTPSGRYWDPTAYSKMLGRTGIADSRRVAFRQRYLQNGIDLVKIVANGTEHEECLVWEDEIVSLTGNTPGYPTVAEAEAAGLFHPSCRHRYVAALPDEKTAVQVPEAIAPDLLAAAVPGAPPLPPIAPLDLAISVAARARPILNELPIVPRTPGAALARRGGAVKKAPTLPPLDPIARFDAGQQEILDRMNAEKRILRLPRDQREVIGDYTGSLYREMNSGLRSGAALPAQMQTRVVSLDAAIAGSSIPEDLIAYRGLSASADRFKVGTVYRDNGFGSWTGERSTGAAYAARAGVPEQTLMRMQMRKGERALYIGDFGGAFEQEILLPRGSTYRVLSVEEGVPINKLTKARVVTVEITPGTSAATARELEKVAAAKKVAATPRGVRGPGADQVRSRGRGRRGPEGRNGDR